MKTFEQLVTVKDSQKSGGPKTCISDETVSMLKDMIERSPEKMSRRKSVHIIVRKY